MMNDEQFITHGPHTCTTISDYNLIHTMTSAFRLPQIHWTQPVIFVLIIPHSTIICTLDSNSTCRLCWRWSSLRFEVTWSCSSLWFPISRWPGPWGGFRSKTSDETFYNFVQKPISSRHVVVHCDITEGRDTRRFIIAKVKQPNKRMQWISSTHVAAGSGGGGGGSVLK